MRVLTAFVGMSTALGSVHGMGEELFVIDADPFAIEQGEDVLIPADLEQALKADVKAAKVREMDIENALVNRVQWTLVESVLKRDLAKIPAKVRSCYSGFKSKYYFMSQPLPIILSPLVGCSLLCLFIIPKHLGRRDGDVAFLQGDERRCPVL